MRQILMCSALFLFVIRSTLIGRELDPVHDFISQLADTEGEPSCIVNGSVNVITGSFIDSEVDCVVAGSRPLYFERSYCSGTWTKTGFDQGSWRHNHYSKCIVSLDAKIDKKKIHQLNLQEYSDISRTNASFSADPNIKGEAIVFSFKKDWNRGYTNVGRGIPWGGTNLKNWKITLSKNSALFLTGSHMEQSFEKNNQSGDSISLNLKTQKLPSGHQLHFTYTRDDERSWFNQHRFYNVTLTNQAKTVTFGSLTMKEPKLSEFEKSLKKEVETSNGQKVNYRFEKKR